MKRRIRAMLPAALALLMAAAIAGGAEARTSKKQTSSTGTHHTTTTTKKTAAKPASPDSDSDADTAAPKPPPPGPPQLTGLQAWPSPASTRIQLSFSKPVTVVAPDSGRSRGLQLTFAGEPLPRADGVPGTLRVQDGIVDSVRVDAADSGAMVRFAFRDTVRFKVIVAPAEEDLPYRIIVEVVSPHAAAVEDKKLASLAQAKKRERLRIVAIDAGHGGDDTGAKGPHGVLEKRVTLGVARALAEELNRIPGIRAVLTRDGDYFVPLRERYHKAERMNADLFISIHANSSRRRGSGSGSEVYFLSMKGATDEATKDLADVENAADLVGGVPQHAEDDLVSILYDLKRNSALQQSQLLAETLLDHMSEADRRIEQRGVKQAGFAVLKSVEFPSALVETAFINNPFEARLLANPDFQQEMGRQLAQGVKAYFQKAGIALVGDSGVSGAGAGDTAR